MRVRRDWKVAVATAAGAVLAFAAVAGAGTRSATVAAAHVDLLGTVLVTPAGQTLYHLTAESGGKIACTGACARAWPPLILKGGVGPVAGAGLVQAKLGTVTRPDGTVQVTYAGFPLYRYAADRSAGAHAGQGVESSWFAITPAGRITKAAAASSATGSGSSTGSGSTGSGSTGSGSTGSGSAGSTPSDGGYGGY